MEFEDRKQDEFERELQAALRRRAAPEGLKQRVLAQSRTVARERRIAQAKHGRMNGGMNTWVLQRIAAAAVLTAAIGGFMAYRQTQVHTQEARIQEQRRGEEAREQVLTALRITSRALDRVNERLGD